METWSKLCRACLTTRESFTYYLFENVSSLTYAFCTSVEAKPEDDLPKALCDMCYNLLVQFTDFKDTCLKSENKLLNQLNFLSDTQLKQEIEKFDVPFEHKDNTERNYMKLNETTELHEDNTDFNDDGDVLMEDYSNESKISKDLNLKKTKRKRLKESSVTQKGKWQLRKVKRKFLLTCQICLKEFTNSKDYEAHNLEHGFKKTIYPCRCCVKKFATWSGLQRHRNSKHSVTRLQELKCKVCGRVCASKESLHMHSRRHVESYSSIICHICGRKCVNDRVLKIHLETHAENRERLHSCEHCGKKYYSNKYLQSHLRLHKNTRYICDYCNYAFTEKHNLVKHIQIHTGQKDYQCDICSKEFNRSCTLKEHKRIHSGERPYNCRFCPKSFISKRRLTEHHRVHTGERPFKCEVCDHRFTQKGTMQRHAKIHLNPCKGKTLL